jgi:hypothetical protein
VYSQESNIAVAEKIDIEARPLYLSQRFQGVEQGKEENSTSQRQSQSSNTIQFRLPVRETNPKILPVAEFLSDEMKSEIQTVMSTLMYEMDVRNRILTLAIKQWVLHFGRTEIVDMDTFFNAFIRITNGGRATMLQTNCKFLLSTSTPHERFFRNHVAFIDFLRIFLRYGTTSGLQDTLEILTPQRGWGNFPCFFDGFCLGFDIATIRSFLAPGFWVLVEGDVCGTFSLITESIETIYVDPSDDIHYLKLVREENIISASSWKSLLQNAGLRPEDGLHIQIPDSLDNFPRTVSPCESPGVILDLLEGFWPMPSNPYSLFDL